MEKVSEGVYRLEVPMRFNPLGCTHSYLLLDSATLIDTGVGTEQARAALRNQLEAAGINLSEIQNVIITHLHGDHIGLVDFVRSVSDATVYAHSSAKQILKERVDRGSRIFRDSKNELRMLGGDKYLSMFGKLERFRGRRRPAIRVDATLDDGEQVLLDGSTLDVFWTPGHAPEHICLFDKDKRLLYSGDHVLPRITSHVSLHTYQKGDPLRDYLKSLDRLKGLPVDTVLPAHEHVFHDLDGRITELKLHHHRRCREIMNTIRLKDKAVFQISAEISWDSKPWAQMDFWSKRMAGSETLAHLIYLKNKGEVKEELRDGVLYYTIR